MPRLIFNIEEILAEVRAAATLAEDFIENPTLAFAELATQLENIRDHKTNAMVAWTIAESRPIRTKHSAGEYERSAKGPTVVGTLSSIWEIKRINPPKAKAPAKSFELVGNASTVIRLFRVSADGQDEEQVAMWRMEIGQDDSPGCHFHVQVLGDSDTIPFPRSLSIPRLPTLMATPPAVLEFLLAELFQERWRKHVFAESSALKRWRAIQRDRLRRLLAWQTQQVSGSTGSPWCTLKAAKPAADLFTA
jgi:hypothetical protein